jgi:hypothetical protein
MSDECGYAANVITRQSKVPRGQPILQVSGKGSLDLGADEEETGAATIPSRLGSSVPTEESTEAYE